MINVIKKEIDMEESLKKRLEIICNFCNTTPIIINDSIRKINKTILICTIWRTIIELMICYFKKIVIII